MLYSLLIGIFLLTQQGLKGAVADVPEPDIEGQKLTLVEAQAKLSEIRQEWMEIAENKGAPNKISYLLYLLKKIVLRAAGGPTQDDFYFLVLAERYRDLRLACPELTEDEAIEFFLANSMPNGPIRRFNFDDPLQFFTRDSEGEFICKSDWEKHCPYFGVKVDQTTGEVIVFNPSPARSRSTSNPVAVQPKQRRIERAVSHPPKPEVPKRERLDSGYSSNQSIRSWQSGDTWFAEV